MKKTISLSEICYLPNNVFICLFLIFFFCFVWLPLMTIVVQASVVERVDNAIQRINTSKTN